MVQEGKTAEVISCREAKVKKPIKGEFQRPIEEAVMDIARGARKVVPAHVEDGERSAREVVPACVEDGERGARQAVPAQMEDGDAGAIEVALAFVEDGNKETRQAVPIQMEDGEAGATKVASQGRVLHAVPEMADEKSSTVQRRNTRMAWADLTLSQLFAAKTGVSGEE